MLFVAMVLSSGCLLTNLFKKKPATPEEKAVAVMQEATTEGKLLDVLQERFDQTGDCTTDEYLRVAKLLGGAVKSEGGQLETDPQKADEIVNTTKACKPRIHWTTKQQSKNMYLVTYWGEVSASCPLEEVKEKVNEMRVVAEVDNASGKAQILEGEMDEATKQKVEALLPGLPLMGDCSAAFILGSGELDATAP